MENTTAVKSAPSAMPEAREVVVYGLATGFAQEMALGRHLVLADEPVSFGGEDTGPNPYELLLAALGSCTSMTVSLYARRKQWPLEAVTVRLRHSRVHEKDSEECEHADSKLDRIESEIELEGTLSDEQRDRLVEIATMCPVHRTLTSKIDIRTSRR